PRQTARGPCSAVELIRARRHECFSGVSSGRRLAARTCSAGTNRAPTFSHIRTYIERLISWILLRNFVRGTLDAAPCQSGTFSLPPCREEVAYVERQQQAAHHRLRVIGSRPGPPMQSAPAAFG